MSKRARADDFEPVDEDGQRTGHSKRVDKQENSAFTELMKPKAKIGQLSTRAVDEQSKKTTFYGRDGLAAYLLDPASFLARRVVYYNDKFVVINDLFPKATVHLLILPRNMEKSVKRPQDAFDDPNFLDECREEEKRVRALAATELQRRIGKFSALDSARNKALDMDSDEPPETLPAGRDWSKEIISGIHANPSMNHLHIHVLSRDMRSECVRKRNHYLSFTTDFFVDLNQFPLDQHDVRRDYKHFPNDMICWRCGKNLQNKMVMLKAHLEEEFDEWKAV